jgi:hypothetical protein
MVELTFRTADQIPTLVSGGVVQRRCLGYAKVVMQPPSLAPIRRPARISRGIAPYIAAILLSMLLAPFAASPAPIYKSIGPGGKVIYSDKPVPGAKVVDLPPISVYKPPPAPPPADAVAAPPPPEPPAPQPGSSYRRVAILTPSPDATLWNTAYTVGVEALVEPPLDVAAGHRLVAVIDGKPVGEPQAQTHFTLHDVFRGAHTLQVSVQDAKGAFLISSPPVTFYIHQGSAGATP